MVFSDLGHHNWQMRSTEQRWNCRDKNTKQMPGFYTFIFLWMFNQYLVVPQLSGIKLRYWNQLHAALSKCCFTKAVQFCKGTKEVISVSIPNQKYYASVFCLKNICLTYFNYVAFFFFFECIVSFFARYPWHSCTDSGKGHHRPAVLHCGEIGPCFSLMPVSALSIASCCL